MNSNNSSDADAYKTKKNVPLPLLKSAPNGELVHSNKHRRYVKRHQVKELAEKRYVENGMGITFEDIMARFGVSKPKAQRKLKHFVGERLLFTAEDIKKEGIAIKGIKRERPQRYYLTELKTRIIESRKNNAQKDTTVDMVSETGIQKAHNFRELLTQLTLYLLYIHKLQIWTSIPPENYELIGWSHKGTAKAITERIGVHTVEFHIHPNGSVMVYVSCSNRPFRLYEEQDVLDILFFLGRVEDRLRYHLSDARDNVIPPVRRWILKACDVGKDVEIYSVAQITLPDIQIPLFEKTLRGYVKPMGDKVFYRVEYSLTPNKPIEEALETLRKDVKIDKDSLSL